MSRVKINKAFTMPREELEEKLQLLAEKVTEEYQLNCEWQSDDCLSFQRSGVQGEINIDGEEVGFSAKLGLLLSAFRGNIESEVQKFFDEHVY